MAKARSGDARSRDDAGARARDDLAALIRLARAHLGPLDEMRMFGGIGFLRAGHLVVGASRRGLLVRIGPEQFGAALAEPDVSPMEMRDRPVVGFIWYRPPEFHVPAVAAWVDRALAYVETLPPKLAKPKPRRRPRGAPV